MTTEEVLQQCTVEGFVVKLPETQLERATYLAVKKKLELIGGKWKSGKVQGFVFNEDPTEYLAQIANGEKRDLKKEYQYFPTPDEIADYLVQLADIAPYHSVLEPSAGQGAIINAIHRQIPDKNVLFCEIMDLNRSFLEKIAPATFANADFLQLQMSGFDRIVANPPFSKNQDIDHIHKMYECLAPNGRMVTISSKHWEFAQGKKEDAFRKWLDKVDARIEVLEPGTFKESGTMVSSLIIIIDKK